MRLRYLLVVLAVVVVVVAVFRGPRLEEPASGVVMRASVVLAWVLVLVAAAPGQRRRGRRSRSSPVEDRGVDNGARPPLVARSVPRPG